MADVGLPWAMKSWGMKSRLRLRLGGERKEMGWERCCSYWKEGWSRPGSGTGEERDTRQRDCLGDLRLHAEGLYRSAWSCHYRASGVWSRNWCGRHARQEDGMSPTMFAEIAIYNGRASSMMTTRIPTAITLTQGATFTPQPRTPRKCRGRRWVTEGQLARMVRTSSIDQPSQHCSERAMQCKGLISIPV